MPEARRRQVFTDDGILLLYHKDTPASFISSGCISQRSRETSTLLIS